MKLVYERTGPGKFSDNVEEWVYSQSQDGVDEELGDAQTYGWYGLMVLDKLVTVNQDGDDWTFAAAILTEDSQGFVSVDYFDDEGSARKAWGAIQNDYSLWLSEAGTDDGFDDEGEEDLEEDASVTIVRENPGLSLPAKDVPLARWSVDQVRLLEPEYGTLGAMTRQELDDFFDDAILGESNGALGGGRGVWDKLTNSAQDVIQSLHYKYEKSVSKGE